MKKKQRNGWGKKLITFSLAAVVGLAAHATAGDVAYDVTGLQGGTDQNITNGSDPILSDAMTDINAAVEAGRSVDNETYEAVVTIDIGNNQTAGGTTVTGGYWNLHGTDDGAPNYTNIGGFKDVTIRGRSANDKTVLQGGSANNELLRVYHVDGDLTVENIKVTGGKYAGGDSAEGAGMNLGADGTTNEQKAADTITLKNIDADSNSIVITGNTAGGNAFGAGIAVNALGVDGGGNLDGHSAVAFENVNLTGNTISFTNSAGGLDASIRGGGARVGYSESFTYAGGIVSRNTVALTIVDTPSGKSPHAAGGGLSIDGAAGVMKKIEITGVAFSENTVTMNNNIATGVDPDTYARGGAVYIATTGLATNDGIAIGSAASATSFSKNAAIAASTSNKRAHAHGGALFMFLNDLNASVTNVSFSENYAKSTAGQAAGGAIGVQKNGGTNAGTLTLANVTFTGNYADGSTDAFGGAVNSYNNAAHAITNGNFSGNYAKAGDNAYGGAVSFLAGGANTITGGRYEGNHATSTGAAGTARGGAVYSAGGSLAIENAVLDGNYAEADSAGGTAQGGAIHMDQGSLTLTDSSVVNNRVSGYAAEGGAIFMNTESATAAALELQASAGKTVTIAGNKTNGVSKSAIYFGNANGGGSNANATFDLTGAGHIELLDPLKVDMDNGQNFTMNKTNTGSFKWNGVNTFTADGGTAAVNLSGGRVYLGSTFTAQGGSAGTAFQVNLTNIGELSFDLSRDRNVALFDFSNANAGNSMTVTGATQINAGAGRAIASFNNKEYLIVKDYAGVNGLISDGTTNGFYIANGQYVSVGSVYTQGNNLYAGISFRSPLESYRNSRNGMYALDHMVTSPWGQANISNAEVAAIYANANNVTPELYMQQAFVMIDGVDRTARSAVEYGLRQPHRSQVALDGAFSSPRPRGRAPGYVDGAPGVQYDGAYPRLMDCSYARGGIRIWTGYVGDWKKVDSHGGYNGYKVDRNGFLLGVNYDFDTFASVGVYGGYTHSKTRSRNASAEVKSDSGHLGAMARLSPLADRALSLYGDVGYHFSNNDSRRNLGHWSASGSFDQDVFTIGLGAEYAFNLGGINLTPHAELRYFGIEQDDMSESGSSATATDVKGFDKDALNTRLGVEVSKDFVAGGMVVSPSINVDWRHEYGTRRYSGRANYYDPAGPIPFNVSSSPADRDSMDIGAAVKALKNFGGTKVGFNLSYNLNLSRRSDTHSLYAGVEVGF